ncbi:NHL repeat-containing protein [Flavobacterium poyangense]|uniref:hypothetical protein n=1 Tax=Flavobacterium poyangense TaxID=2204302 RepID=UPI0014238F79|nr:hypothetical protein [Flavobacterium sp. JXAS1]
MKKFIYALLLGLIFIIPSTAQKKYNIQNQLQLSTVPLGLPTDSIMVVNSNGNVNYIPKSSITSRGSTISGTVNKIAKFNSEGKNVSDSNITDDNSLVTIAKPIEIKSGSADVAGLKFANATATSMSSTVNYGTTGTYPWDMIVDQYGTTYVTDRKDNNVRKTPVGGPTTILANTGAYPSGIVIDSKGNIFTVNRDSSTITKIEPNGNVITSWASWTYIGSCLGIEIDEFDNLYTVATTATVDTVLSITPAGSVTTVATKNLGLHGTYSFVRNKSNGIIYTVDDGGRVIKYLPTGASSVLRTGYLGGGISSALDQSTGIIYVHSLNGLGSLFKILPDGTTTILAAVQGGWDIKVDSQSNVYTVGSNGVTKTTPDGVATVIGATADDPRLLAVAGNGSVYVACKSSRTFTRITQPTTRNILSLDPSGNVLTNGDFYTDANGTGYLPSALPSFISGDLSGKSIITREYLSKKIGSVAPLTSADTGTAGDIRIAAGYIYWYVVGTGWLRSAGTTF